MRCYKLFFLLLLLNGCVNLLETPDCTLKPKKSEVIVSKPAVQTSFLAATVYFADGNAELTPENLLKLQEVAKRAEQLNAEVRILGHASHRTRITTPAKRKMINLNISYQRALAVMNALLQDGVSEEKLRFEALSDNRPAEIEVNSEAEAANRRVEIFLYF